MAVKTTKDLTKLKQTAKATYDAIGEVTCPALNAKVHFTSEGFHHLRYSHGKERPVIMQEAKLRLVPKVKWLVETTTTIQEYSEGMEEIHRKKHKKVSKQWLMVQYWGFTAIVRGTRMKVVVRRVDNGAYQFWSAIPMWRSKKYDQYSVIDKSMGNLAED